MKLSHSSQQKWLTCGHSYFLHYKENWRPVTLSSNLIFGSAIDEALNVMLENKDTPGILAKSILAFDKKWEQGENSLREVVDMPLNPNIEYGRQDFDADLLEKSDWAELFKYDAKLFETKKVIEDKIYPKEDENGDKPEPADWLTIPEEQRMVYNYMHWKCMSKKGHILLKAYFEELLPYVKKTIAVQVPVSLLDEEGNDLNGVIDFVAELDGSKLGLDFDPVAIVDNKTTSTKYADNAVDESEQLAKYQAILNIKASDPNDPWTHKISHCAYAVVSKKLAKQKTCTKCGHEGKGLHKKCDNEIDGERCNGEWNKVLSGKTQFIIGEISAQKEQEVLENANTVKSCIEMGLYPKNYSQCSNMYGRKCPFLGLCHGGDTTGLVKLEKK